MAFTVKRVKEIKSRILAGHIMEVLAKNEVLYTRLGSRKAELDGKDCQLVEIGEMTLEEQENLEKQITDQIELNI